MSSSDKKIFKKIPRLHPYPLTGTPISGTIHLMNQGTKTVSTAAKDILARLLASEDLTVQHDPKAETAYFDTANRVLCLPVWEDMDSHMYDMLVGHEVSHALFTPADGWQGFVGDDSNSQLRHMCLNVCEDARIERKIKDKFPGLRRDFARAYKVLHDKDIFEMKGKAIADLPLIDRINLYYKGEIYGQMTVPFTTEEREFITRLDAASTFEDIIEVAKDLFEDTKQEQEEQEPEQPEEGEDGTTGDGSGGSDSEKGDSEDTGAGAGAGEEGEEEGDQTAKGAEGQDGEEDTGDSASDNTDDGESADSTDGDMGSKDGETDLSYDSYGEGHAPGTTQQNYDKAKSDLRNTASGSWDYYDIPKSNLDKIVISSETIADLWTKFWGSIGSQQLKYYEEYQNESQVRLREFQNKSKAIINHMVQQFQQKQAADASKRSHTAKTGVLDTTTMINYRWSEDIFLKNEVHSEGKSHGIVMFLDWSGSMSNILQDTVEQLLILVEFCRKAGIPYDVHAFTSNTFVEYFGSQWGPEAREVQVKAAEKYQGQFETTNKSLNPHQFHLLNFLNSSQNARQHQEAVKNLYYLAYTHGHRGPSCLGLGSTPLNEAVIAALDLVPEFQNKHGIQIVNTVFLTDGDGHAIAPYDYGNSKVILTDPVTKKTYDVDFRGGGRDTSALLQCLKDRTGCSTIGIRLHDGKSANNLRYRYFDVDNGDWNKANKQFEDACKSYKKDHHFICDVAGYDLHLVVKGNLKVETDPMEELDENASAVKIRNAFIKGGNRKKSSRVIANRMVDVIAVS